MVFFVVCGSAADDRRNESSLGQRQQVAVGRHDLHFFHGRHGRAEGFGPQVCAGLDRWIGQSEVQLAASPEYRYSDFISVRGLLVSDRNHVQECAERRADDEFRVADPLALATRRRSKSFCMSSATLLV